jgi:hypothetical protein
MAVLITTESIVKTVNPPSDCFDVGGLNELIKGWVAPIKIGPVWIIYNESLKEGPINKIASDVFNMSLRGEVLVIPSQQLPIEWGLCKDTELSHSSSEIDNSFLLTVQSVLILKQLMQESDIENSYEVDDILNSISIKEEWIYDPNLNEQEKEIKDFFRSIFEFITTSEIDILKDLILYEDEDILVTVKNINDMILTLNQMIDMYVESEEYENCAKLKNIILKLD